MVYCGKPSKGCAACRAKRTKCDLKRPSCSQCSRKHIECPGYRDEQALVFRDETERLVRPRKLFHNSASRSTTPGVTSTPETGSHSPIDVLGADIRPERIPLALVAPLEDQAVCYFFQQFIWKDEVFRKGTWDFLPGVYSQVRPDSVIADCVTALGLLGLANTKRIQVPPEATARYSRALRSVNRALQDPAQVKSDLTLITVDLLGQYESSSCQTIGALRAWAKHVDGATALIRLRGKEQLRTRLGRRLYIHTRAQILISCTHRKKHAPDFIEEWSSLELEFHSPVEQHAERLILLGVRLCNLQADFYEDPYYPPSQALAQIEAVDEAYDQWLAQIPPVMRYQIKYITEPSEVVFGNKYHVYKGLWVAMLWNHYRTMHVLVKAIKWDRLQRLATSPPMANQASQWVKKRELTLSVMKDVSMDIVASVPFFLGFHRLPPDVKQPPPMHGSCASLLLWPLYSAGAPNIDEPAVIDWTVKRLRQLTDDTGIMQGRVVADMLYQNRRLTVNHSDRMISESEPHEAWSVTNC